MKSVLYDTYANDDYDTCNEITSFLGSINYNVGSRILLLGNIDNLGNCLKQKGLDITILEEQYFDNVCYSLIRNNNCNIVRGSLEQLPFVDESFDKVIILEHFNTLNNYKIAVNEIKRVLKDSGEIILEDLNLKSIKVKLKNLKHKVCGDKNNYCYPNDIKELFLSYGFEGNIKEISNDRYLYIGKIETR